MGFVHARLLIFYNARIQNPVIPFLTQTNIFNQELNKDGSDILDILSKLGNDYQIEETVDYLSISINFLPDKIQLYSQFLKTLYRHKPFSISSHSTPTYYYGDEETAIKKKLKKSIDDYWTYFTQQSNWEKTIALRIAYDKLFSNNSFRNSQITNDSLSRINISRIRSFYQDIYTPSNSLLVLKGNLTNASIGLFEIALKSFKKEKPIQIGAKSLKISNSGEIVIFNINTTDTPKLYWIETIPPLQDNDHITMQIINDIIFAYPIGRLTRSAPQINVRILKINTQRYNHYKISLLCNRFELSFKNIEKIIQLITREKRRLKLGGIDRKEYLDAAKYFYGKLKVQSADYNHDILLEIQRSLYNPPIENLIPSPELFQQITINKLNQTVEDTSRHIIVIVGNADLIRNYFRTIKPTVIRFIQ